MGYCLSIRKLTFVHHNTIVSFSLKLHNKDANSSSEVTHAEETPTEETTAEVTPEHDSPTDIPVEAVSETPAEGNPSVPDAPDLPEAKKDNVCR